MKNVFSFKNEFFGPLVLLSCTSPDILYICFMKDLKHFFCEWKLDKTYYLSFNVLGTNGTQPLMDINVALWKHLQTRRSLSVIEV